MCLSVHGDHPWGIYEHSFAGFLLPGYITSGQTWLTTQCRSVLGKIKDTQRQGSVTAGGVDVESISKGLPRCPGRTWVGRIHYRDPQAFLEEGQGGIEMAW